MLSSKLVELVTYFKIGFFRKKIIIVKSGSLYVFLFLLLLITIKCSNPKTNFGYTKDSLDNYFQLLIIGDGLINPNKSDVITLDVELKTQEDSLFFNSQHSTKNGMIIHLSDPEIKPYFITYFRKLVVGDSASILMPPKLFFNSFFDTIPPLFCINDSVIKFNFSNFIF